METHQKIKEELSVYNNASKMKIRFIILIHRLFRFLISKSFDFIISMALILTVPFLFVAFSVNILFVCVLTHFFYWTLFYLPMSKRFENNDYETFTIRIETLKDMLSRK